MVVCVVVVCDSVLALVIAVEEGVDVVGVFASVVCWRVLYVDDSVDLLPLVVVADAFALVDVAEVGVVEGAVVEG